MKTRNLLITSLILKANLVLAEELPTAIDIAAVRAMRMRLEQEEEKSEEVKRAALAQVIVLGSQAAAINQPKSTSVLPNRCPMVVDKVSGSLTLICGDNLGQTTTIQQIQKNSNNRVRR